LVLDGKENVVEIAADLNTMDKLQGVTVKGSEATTCYTAKIQEMFTLNDARQLNPETLKPIVDKGCNALIKSVLSLNLLSSPDGLKYLPDFKKIAESLASEMPGTRYATEYQQILVQVEQAATQQQQQVGESPVGIGQPAPEISYPDPSGNIRNLSDLKGKVVLLDFWASWCGPCRRENPHVVEVYKKYKAKGFEIFSVSLDREAGAWKNAIAQDGLLWENHVSDLKHWASAPAKLYGVSSIPRTFLIGRDGKIAAVNPRQNLEAELLKVLN
jgi:thiol-disulfide isomerase/thioredoxin